MTLQQPRTTPHGRLVHQALIYHSDDELMAVAVPFLRAGAEAGEPTLVGVNAQHRDALWAELDDVAGITELDPAHYRDPLSALLANQRLLVALARGGAEHIRVVGEIPHDPWPDWLRYEAAVNDLFADFPVHAICPHDARTTPGDVLADVERTHPYLVRPDGRVVESRLYQRPADLLAERARANADPLEAETPDVVAADPAPVAAADAVFGLAQGTRLDADSADVLRLSVRHVVANAVLHGQPPVSLRAWAAPDRVVALTTDAGPGLDDPWVGLLPPDPDADPQDANSLYLVHQALSEVAMFRCADGFSVRLIERARCG